MQYTTLALGGLILLFGIYTAIMSVKSPDELPKLKFFKDKLGLKVGFFLHGLAYVIVPLIFGYFIVQAGIDGVGVKEFFTEKR